MDVSICHKGVPRHQTLHDMNLTDDTLQSVAQTLHMCTSSLITSVVDCYLDKSNAQPQITGKLLRRVLTALVHHCPKAAQFTVLGDLLVEKLDDILQELVSSAPDDVETIRRMLDVMSVPCAVRRGSRLTRE